LPWGYGYGNDFSFEQVIAVGHECDLALISVLDDEFWEGTLALELDDVPQLQQVVIPCSSLGFNRL
jgi:hypothetical protein